jgi:predicted alpha-1,2-mannosidase
MKSYLLLFLLALASFSLYAQPKERLTNYVDPFIGTGGHGHTFPGAQLPFGMVQLGPDNIQTSWDYCSGYHFPDNKILGFSHTHLSGTGGSDLMDIRLQPTQKDTFTTDLQYNGRNVGHQFAAFFDFANEHAEPGYYSTIYNESGIKSEMTATYRAGFSCFTYQSGKQNLLLDLSYIGGDPQRGLIKEVNDSLVQGYVFTSGWAKNQKVYFAIRFSKPILSVEFCKKGTPVKSLYSEINGTYLLALFRFGGSNNVLMSKVGISSVSMDGALQNLDNEINAWNFEAIRKQASDAWEKELEHIQVESKDLVKKRIFYTAYYHNLVAPTLFTDVDGQFRGEDEAIYKAKGFDYYTVFSLWDTYRATHPFYTLVEPEKVSEFVQTMLLHYRISGLLPIWTLSGEETWGMSGTHSIPVIVDAYFKGIKGFDPEEAYQAVRKSVMQDDRAFNWYKRLGYVPLDKQAESGSCSMEYYYDDWCVAQFAKALGKMDDFNYFLERAKGYVKQFNPHYGTMQPRNCDGSWMEPFDPIAMGGKYGFTEGDAWQYSFSVQHDVGGLIKLMGGARAFEKKLDSLFSVQNTVNPGEVLDVTGVIGLYAHGNEPCHHIPYLYNFIGKGWKSQQKIKTIRDSLYTDQRDGLCGNDDCGQVSAWYLFSALGFYPVNPADGHYILGTPAFEKVTLKMPEGKNFVIIAKNLDKGKFYVRSVKLNGKHLSGIYITHHDIVNGGTLEFDMSAVPKK